MLKAVIKPSPNFIMAGAELRRVWREAGLTQLRLAEKMDAWGWTRDKVCYLQSKTEFELDPREMTALLDVLGAKGIMI